MLHSLGEWGPQVRLQEHPRDAVCFSLECKSTCKGTTGRRPDPVTLSAEGGRPVGVIVTAGEPRPESEGW